MNLAEQIDNILAQNRVFGSKTFGKNTVMQRKNRRKNLAQSIADRIEIDNVKVAKVIQRVCNSDGYSNCYVTINLALALTQEISKPDIIRIKEQ